MSLVLDIMNLKLYLTEELQEMGTWSGEPEMGLNIGETKERGGEGFLGHGLPLKRMSQASLEHEGQYHIQISTFRHTMEVRLSQGLSA